MGDKYSKGVLVQVPVPKVIPQKVGIKRKIKEEVGTMLEGLEKTISKSRKDKLKPYGYK